MNASGSSLLFKASMNITKPLRRVLKVLIDGQIKPSFLQYGRFIDFCFCCGRCIPMLSDNVWPPWMRIGELINLVNGCVI